VRVCFVTHRAGPNLTEDDRRAAEACATAGMTVEPAAWDDGRVDWDSYDRLVLRSTWNYHLETHAFAAWLDRIDGLGVGVLNPVDVVRWNARKDYLLELERAGVPVVPTRVLPPGASVDPAAWMSEFDTADAVIKPAVGASAHGVTRIRMDDDGALDRARAAVGGPVLIQPFEPAIQERGEWSAIFLGGVYSHAVLKRPARGDFRVQEELGGRSVTLDAPPAVRALGRAALAHVPGPTLYARVDAVETRDSPRLMELELIEPALYFAADSSAPGRFAACLGETDGAVG